MIVADALPPSACVLVVPLASDKSPQCVFGAAIVGTEAERATAAAWAKAHGQTSTPSKGEGGVDEVLIIFSPTMTMPFLAQLYADQRAGKFGTAQFQLFIAPQATSADGIDLDTEARVADAGLLVAPAR